MLIILKMKITLIVFILICLNLNSQEKNKIDSTEISKTTSFDDNSSKKKNKKEDVSIKLLNDTIKLLKELNKKHSDTEEENKILKNKLNKANILLSRINERIFINMLESFYSFDNLNKYVFSKEDTIKIGKYKLLIESIELDENSKKYNKSLIEKAKEFNEIHLKLSYFEDNLDKKFDSTEILNTIKKLRVLSINEDFKSLNKVKNEKIKIFEKYLTLYNLSMEKFKSCEAIKDTKRRTEIMNSFKIKLEKEHNCDLLDYPYLLKIIDNFPKDI